MDKEIRCHTCKYISGPAVPGAVPGDDEGSHCEGLPEGQRSPLQRSAEGYVISVLSDSKQSEGFMQNTLYRRCRWTADRGPGGRAAQVAHHETS